MITPDKQRNALYALQNLLVYARSMAYESGDRRLAELLDSAEYLPKLIAEPSDRTETFRGVLEDLADAFAAPVLLADFDRPVPSQW